MNVSDGLDDIWWIRCRRGDRLPAASYILLPNQEKGLCLTTGERSTSFAVCFLPTARGHVFLYQTPGRRPPRNSGRNVNNVTKGWVGAPNGRPPFAIHGAAVGVVDRRLSRTHNLAASFSSPRKRKKNNQTQPPRMRKTYFQFHFISLSIHSKIAVECFFCERGITALTFSNSVNIWRSCLRPISAQHLATTSFVPFLF